MDEEILRQFEEAIKAIEERFGFTTKQMKSFGDATKKSSAEFQKRIEDLRKEVTRNVAGYKDQLRVIKELNEAIDDLSDTTEDNAKKSQLAQQRDELAREAANQAILESSEQFSQALVETTVRTTGEFVKRLQEGSNAQDQSRTLMFGAIDIAGAGLQSAGNGLTKFGTALANTQGWISQLGGMLALGGGMLIEGVGEAGTKFLKFSVEVLSRELQKTQEVFYSTNAVGAVFADGMTGMRNASADAGLNLKQFSSVVAKSSIDMSLSGLGVAEGARKVGLVGKIFDQEGGRIREEMIRLGYGFEEQAELTATVMGNIRRTNQAVNVNVLAEQTRKYAENLRLISALTGEDAKAKTKQVQEQNQIAAFQNQIAKMGPAVAANIDSAMSLMTETEKKAFRDRVIFQGAVINQEAALFEATNRAAAERGRMLYEKFLTGTFDPKTVAEANARYQQASIQAFRDNQALFTAGFATNDAMLQAQAQAGLDAYNRDLKITGEALATITDTIAQVAKPGDELTDGFVGATVAAQKMAVLFEEKLLPLLGTYAETVDIVNTSMLNFINKMLNDKKQPVDEKVLREQMLIGGVDVRTNEPLTSAQLGVIKAGGPLPEIGKKGMALGGISTGPVSGHVEVLHGTEAVVPLPDNRSIPVTLDSSSLTSAVNQQSTILNEILNAMKNQNGMTSQIVQNSY